jgi:hypothetical protein
MTNQEAAKMQKPLWRRILMGLGRLCFLLASALAVLVVLLFILDCLLFWRSYVYVRNFSGSDVRFEKVIINGEVVAGSSDLIHSPKDPSQPWLDTRRRSLSGSFRPWKKTVELTVVVLDDKQVRRTLSCTLAHRKRSCLFNADYFQGKLVCHDCVNID